MPIRINLLAETQSAEEARRRDPVKRVMWVCAALVAGMLAWSGTLFLKVRAAQENVQNQESRWKQNEAAFKLITDAQKQLVETQRKLDSLVGYSTNRFLWAPVLNGLQQAIVPVVEEIQLEQLRGTQAFDAVVPLPSDKKVLAKSAAVERITLLLRARDFGNPTEANYNKFKAVLNNQAYLKTLLPKSDGVRLYGAIVGPQADPSNPNRTYYTFALECRFTEIRHDE